MNRKHVIGIFLALVIVLFSGITTSPVMADTNHCGTIASSEVWSSAGNVHVLTCNVIIPAGVTLTISPGAIVKFYPNTKLVVNGTLIADGANEAGRIFFTSIKDDTVGGDTNGDGLTSSPGVSDWAWVEFGASSSATLDYLTIRYSGATCCGLTNHAALYAVGYKIPNVGDHVVLTNNWAEGIELPGGNLPSPTYSLPYYPAAAYYVRSDLTVLAGATVTITPGAILKFPTNTRLIINGTLNAVGTGGNLIYFTSIKDDTVGGDTNGDGISNGTPGDWGGINFTATSSNTSIIDHAVIRYSANANISIVGASPTIQFSIISNGSQDGIRVQNSSAALTCNDIVNNNALGLRNNTPTLIFNAINQYWGSRLGPYHSTSNPTGAGNGVSDGVNFNPWRNGACVIIPPAPINLQASDGTFINKVVITWTTAVGTDPDHYEIYRADSGTGSKSLIGSSINPSFDDNTAVPGITYTFWVKACSLAGGCSNDSAPNSGWAKEPKFIYIPIIKKP